MITFDFEKYYHRLAKERDELEKIKIEAEYFRYYDALSKEEQENFKQLDRKTRQEEAVKIKAEINRISQLLLQ